VSPNATEWRELTRTTGSGVEVALLWYRSSNRVKVVVSDRRLCQHLDLELVATDAVSAFDRPFRDAVSPLLPANGATNERAIA
jgi:hypothetical protein